MGAESVALRDGSCWGDTYAAWLGVRRKACSGIDCRRLVIVSDTPSPSQALIGDDVTFTIVVRNDGAMADELAVFVDAGLINLSPVSVSAPALPTSPVPSTVGLDANARRSHPARASR